MNRKRNKGKGNKDTDQYKGRGGEKRTKKQLEEEIESYGCKVTSKMFNQKKQVLEDKLKLIKNANCEKFKVVIPEIDWPGISVD